MKLTTRLAQRTDLDALLAIEAACFTCDQLSRRSFLHLLSSPSAEIWILAANQRIIGYGLLFFRKNSQKARLYSIAIQETHRQRGGAATLNAILEKRALSRGYDRIILEVRVDNTAAITFYKKHAYRVFGKYNRFYEDGTDALRMEKLL
jgi:ribosomal protein S18 acetylase RimI-like enzyme